MFECCGEWLAQSAVTRKVTQTLGHWATGRVATANMASPGLQAYRGPNHVLVTRRSTRVALRARTRKLIDSQRWPAVHLHGLGAAIATTIVLAAELVAASEGQLVASCSTSTEVLVDHDEIGCAKSTVRHNSAVHVSLSRLLPLHACTAGNASRSAPRRASKNRKQK